MCADWNQLFHDPSKVIRDPDPVVEEFSRELRAGAKVLDLGCGGGRHLFTLAKAGLKAIGSDISPQGLKLARDWLRSANLSAELLLSQMTALPLTAVAFDGAISINVMNHATFGYGFQAVSEIHRILKTGSPFFFVILGRDDFRCGEGDEIEPFTFVHQQGIEAGVPHHYYDRTEIERLVSAFKRTEITERRRPYDPQDPVFGNDPRAHGRKDASTHHWAVKAWK